MRLSSKEIAVIKALVAKVYGEQARVFLFGSRTEDALRGGDVDLLIQSEVQHRLNLENKIQFLIQLKEQIGDQRIDVVYDNQRIRQQPSFYKSLKQQSIQL
jgi:uncharacterized protein